RPLRPSRDPPSRSRSGSPPAPCRKPTARGPGVFGPELASRATGDGPTDPTHRALPRLRRLGHVVPPRVAQRPTCPKFPVDLAAGAPYKVARFGHRLSQRKTYPGEVSASRGCVMELSRRLGGRSLAAALIVALAAPVPVWSAVAPLGTARGFGLAKLSVDTGKSWLLIGQKSFPILDGTVLRSAEGGAVLDLADGSRVDVFPFSALRFENSGPPTEAAKISLLYGRVSFRLAERTRVRILTPPARLEPIHPGLIVAEGFVSGSGLMGLKLAEGDLQVIRAGPGAPRALLASREPVFLPKKPT